MTIVISTLAMLGALAGGLAVALARLSRYRALRALTYGYTELFRTTPFLVQLLWIFYALPRLGGPALTPFSAGLIALVLNLSAFLGEIYRAGMIAIPRGVVEAGIALG